MTAPGHTVRPTPATAPTTARRPALRGVLMLPAAAALLAGLDAALALLGLPTPVDTTRLREAHGTLMVLGFVGTLVSLERAVALDRRLAYLSPACIAVGSLLAVTDLPATAGRAVLLAGLAGMGAIHVLLWRRQRDDAVLIQTMGVALAVGAATMWVGDAPIATILPWLAGFLVLVIAGERLELARLGMGAGAGRDLVVLSGALMAAATASALWPREGRIAFGAALLALCCWLAARDVARRTIRATGLPRFSAAGLLAGYFWLLVAGTTWLLGGGTGRTYDVVVHAVFLGFVISMIMVHAPVIVPAVLRRPLPFSAWMWVPLVLLHASLAVRLWGGVALGSTRTWQAGGVLNEVALLAFLATALTSLLRSRTTKAHR